MLRNLRANVELLDGDFGNVYLDNARPYGMSERIFRSCLSRSSSGGLHLIWHSERQGAPAFLRSACRQDRFLCRVSDVGTGGIFRSLLDRNGQL